MTFTFHQNWFLVNRIFDWSVKCMKLIPPTRPFSTIKLPHEIRFIICKKIVPIIVTIDHFKVGTYFIANTQYHKHWDLWGVAVVWWSTHRLGNREVHSSNLALGISFSGKWKFKIANCYVYAAKLSKHWSIVHRQNNQMDVHGRKISRIKSTSFGWMFSCVKTRPKYVYFKWVIQKAIKFLYTLLVICNLCDFI